MPQGQRRFFARRGGQRVGLRSAPRETSHILGAIFSGDGLISTTNSSTLAGLEDHRGGNLSLLVVRQDEPQDEWSSAAARQPHTDHTHRLLPRLDPR